MTTTDAVSGSDTHVAQSAADFQWSGNSLEPGIGIALSGGGFRAMLFHAGALARLNEFGLLSKAKRISSVSGGSIAAGYLARVWTSLGAANPEGVLPQFQQLYVEKILEFSREKIDVSDILTGLLPWTSAGQQVAKSYEKYLFDAVTLQDLPDEPRFVFCATNLQTGVLWRFSKPYAGDYLVGRIDNPDTRLSMAVTASSAFPPFLSPVAFDYAPGTFKDWPGMNAASAAPFRDRVLLCDGGVYDNHGLEPIEKRYMTLFVSDGGAPFARNPDVQTDPIRQLQRVLDVEDNQVRALRRRELMSSLIDGGKAFAAGTLRADQTDPDLRMGAYWGINTDPAKVNPSSALPCKPQMADKLAHLSTRLSDLGEAESKELINWGYTICDRSLRANYTGPVVPNPAIAAWPYPEAPLG